MSGPKTHPWIEKLGVYSAGKSKAAGTAKPVKLSANESALGPSPLAMDAYRNEAPNLFRYPDPVYADLRAALADKYDLEASRIVCGVGSDELLKTACRAYLGPGDEALFVAHSFSMYPIAIKSVGAAAIEVPDVDYKADVDKILTAVTERTKLIFIANPNNPTGTYISRRDVKRLIENISSNILLVYDAAYAEFMDQDDYTDGIELVEHHENVFVTRTFSKLYGLAALRLGWGYAPKNVAETLDKCRDPFNVPSSAQAAGVAALKDTEFEQKVISHTAQWRDWLSTELSSLGLTVIPSVTNFILFRFDDENKSAASANEFLTKRGYILRYYSGQGLDKFLRLTIGTADENEEVIKLLKEFLED